MKFETTFKMFRYSKDGYYLEKGNVIANNGQ